MQAVAPLQQLERLHELLVKHQAGLLELPSQVVVLLKDFYDGLS